MTLLKWIWAQDEHEIVDPAVIYYTLRLVMLTLSFVLEDWAVHELVRSPRHWRQAAILVTSSYVTWTFQTHTFSNSVETLVVLWSLVVIERILRENVRVWPRNVKCPALTWCRSVQRSRPALCWDSFLSSAPLIELPFLLSL